MASKVRYATAVEDYVKVIYAHTEWQPEPITTTVLAGRLGLAASSVTEMVKKLGAQGLADHVPYGAVKLTPDGTALALRMVRRHRLIETWLVGQFGYGWHEVHDEAEVLEHALSDRLLDSIDEQLGYPTRDPHGDPIPSRDGRVEQPPAVLLRRIGVGETVRVVRISDRDPALLRRLEDDSITLDREFTVESVHPFTVRLRPLGDAVAIADASLDSIWVGR